MLLVLMFCSSVSFQILFDVMLDVLQVRRYQLGNTDATAELS